MPAFKESSGCLVGNGATISLWNDSWHFYASCFPPYRRSFVLSAIWNATVPKIKGFSWLLLLDRLNTRDLMDRKHCNKGLCHASFAILDQGISESPVLSMPLQSGLLGLLGWKFFGPMVPYGQSSLANPCASEIFFTAC